MASAVMTMLISMGLLQTNQCTSQKMFAELNLVKMLLEGLLFMPKELRA